MSDHDVPLPEYTKWPSFPFEGDVRVRRLEDPVAVEPSRHGEDAADCMACNTPDDGYIWVNERWRVRGMERPTGLPMVLILESRSHFDLGDLPNMLAAELGILTVRLERAVRSLDGVARVHVNRWGDGSAHLHLWFLARPRGRLQLRGTFLPLWDDILPPIPELQWRENLAMVAAWLAEFDGQALAEPPHIAWQAPSTFGSPAPDAARQAVGPAVLPAASAADPTADAPSEPQEAPDGAGVETGRSGDSTGAARQPQDSNGQLQPTGPLGEDGTPTPAGQDDAPTPAGQEGAAAHGGGSRTAAAVAAEGSSIRRRTEHGATPAQRAAPAIESNDAEASTADSSGTTTPGAPNGSSGSPPRHHVGGRGPDLAG